MFQLVLKLISLINRWTEILYHSKRSSFPKLRLLNLIFQQNQDVSYVVDDGMSNFGVSRSQESIFDELLRPSAASTSATTTTMTSTMCSSSHLQSSNYAPNFSSQEDIEVKPFFTSTTPIRPPSPPATSLMAEKSGRLTLGKRSLAGIVISSGPGGHFETYEGTKVVNATTTRRNPRRVKNSDGKGTSLLRVNNTKPDTSQTDTSVSDVSNFSFVAPVSVADHNLAFNNAATKNATDTSVAISNGNFSCFDRIERLEFQLPELSVDDVSSTLSSTSVPDQQQNNLSPQTCIPASMHELSLNMLEGCEVEIPTGANFEQQDECDDDDPPEIGDSTMEDLFGGHGKYFKFVSSTRRGRIREPTRLLLIARRLLTSALIQRCLGIETANLKGLVLTHFILDTGERSPPYRLDIPSCQQCLHLTVLAYFRRKSIIEWLTSFWLDWFQLNL